MEHHPILIIGGGLAGLTTALVLARRGMASAVIDSGDGAAIAAHEKVRTTTLNPFAMGLLAEAGIIAHMQTAGHAPIPITAIKVSDSGGKKAGGDSPLLNWEAEDADTPLAFVVRNADLLEAVRAMARAESLITLHHKTRIAEYAAPDSRGGYATATLTDDGGKQWQARLIIACDGAASAMRGLAGIKTMQRDPRQTAIVADIKCARPHAHTAWQRFLDGGPLALMPLAGERMASLVWTLGNDDAAAMMAEDDDAFSDALSAAAESPFGELRVAGARHAWPLQLRYVPQPYAKAGRVVLVGDAAHAVHPLAGQGFNLAGGDVAALAEILEEARRKGSDVGSDDVLGRYARRRAAEVAAMTLATDGLNMLFASAPPGLRAMGASAMAVLDKTPLKKIARDVATGKFSDTL